MAPPPVTLQPYICLGGSKRRAKAWRRRRRLLRAPLLWLFLLAAHRNALAHHHFDNGAPHRRLKTLARAGEKHQIPI